MGVDNAMHFYNDTPFNAELVDLHKTPDILDSYAVFLIPPSLPLPIIYTTHSQERELLLRLLDHEGNTLKTVTFLANRKSSWVITYDGVGPRQRGGKNGEVDNVGQFYSWGWNYDFRNLVETLKETTRMSEGTPAPPPIASPSSIPDYEEALNGFLDGPDELETNKEILEAHKKINDEIKTAFAYGSDRFKEAFATTDNFLAALKRLVAFPGNQTDLNSRLHLTNVLLLVLRKNADEDKVNFPTYAAVLMKHFNEMLGKNKDNPDVLVGFGVTAGMQEPYCDDAIVQALLKAVNFPATQDTWEVGLQFLQKPEIYFKDAEDYKKEVFNRIVEMKPGEVTLQKSRENMLKILQFTIHDGVDGDKLMKFIEEMIAVFDTVISGDRAVKEDEENDMEGFIISKICLPALDLNIYANKSGKRIPKKIINFMGKMREDYLKGSFLTYALDILKNGTAADTEYADALSFVFIGAKNNSDIFTDNKDTSSILLDVVCSDRFRFENKLHEHILQTLAIGFGSLKIGKEEINKLTEVVQTQIKTKNNKFVNIMKTVETLAQVGSKENEHNFADEESRKDFQTKLGSLFKDHIAESASITEKGERSAYFEAFTALLKFGYRLEEGDIDGLIGLLEKSTEKPDLVLISTLETALKQMKGVEVVKNSEKWLVFLMDQKLDTTGRFPAAILTNIKLPADQVQLFIETLLPLWDNNGQHYLLAAIWRLASADGFAEECIASIIPLLKKSELAEAVLQVVTAWIKNKNNKIETQVKAMLEILKDPSNAWIFDIAIQTLFDYHTTVLERGADFDPKGLGLLDNWINFVHRGLDTDGNDVPSRRGTELLILMEPFAEKIEDKIKAEIAVLLKSQITNNRDPEVKGNLVQIGVMYKWSTITLADMSNVLNAITYKQEIVEKLIPLHKDAPSEEVALKLATYLSNATTFNGIIIPEFVQGLLSSTKVTETFIELVKFISSCVRNSYPTFPEGWIKKVLDSAKDRKPPALTDEQLEIMEFLAKLIFDLEIHYGVDKSTWTDWKPIMDKYKGESIMVLRYANLIDTAIIDRLDTPEEKIDVNNYGNSWAADWARFEPAGFHEYAEKIILSEVKSLKMATKLQVFCLGADMACAFKPKKEDEQKQDSSSTTVSMRTEVVEKKPAYNPLDTQASLYMHAIAMMANMNTTELSTTEEVTKLKGKFKDHELTTFEAIIKKLAKTYVLTKNWENSKTLLETVLIKPDTTTLKNLDTLKSIHIGDLKDYDTIPELKEVKNVSNKIDMPTFSGQVGLDLFTPAVQNLVKFVSTPDILRGSKFEAEVPWGWAEVAVKGFVLSSILQDKVNISHQQDKTLEKFEPLWNSLSKLLTPLRHNTAHIQQDVDTFTKLKATFETLQKETGSWKMESIHLAMFLMVATRFTESKDPVSFSGLKSTWLKQVTGNSEISEDIQKTFWDKALDVGFIDGTNTGLNALTILLKNVEKIDDAVLKFMDHLKDMEMKDSLGTLLNSIPTVRDHSEDGKLNLDHLSNYLENSWLETKAGKIFTNKNIPQRSIFTLMLKAANSFGGPKNDFASLKAILKMMGEKLNTDTDDVIQKQLTTYVALIQAMYTYSLEPKMILKVMDDVVAKWVSQLSVAPTKEDLKERSLDEIIALLKDDKASSLDFDKIKGLCDAVNKKVEECKNRKEEEITTWAKQVGKDTDLAEVIAGIARASIFKPGQTPRNAQIVALLSLIQSFEKGNGRLAKIETGEGKSLIIAMFAAYLKLTQNLQVDIVTPSTILSAAGQKAFENFYKILSIESGYLTNVPTENNYKKDVLYGDPQTFQSDCLKEDFHHDTELRNKRPFSFVLVDEVDSMLIDQAANTTKLVEPVPGVELLSPLFAVIWRIVNDMGNLLIPIENEQYCPQELKEIKCEDLLTVLAVLTKTHGSAALLTQSVENFAEKMEKKEKTIPEARQALKVLIRGNIIPGDIGDKDNPTTTDVSLDEIIKKRWNTKLKTSLLQACNKYLGRKIQIWNLSETGPQLSPTYHEKGEPYDIPDHYQTLPILETDKGKLVELIKVSEDKATEFVFNRIIEDIKKLLIFSDDKNVDRDNDKIKLPLHFKDLYTFKLERWVRSAITARYFVHENQDYILQKPPKEKITRIIPVDWQNTGALEESSVWPDGVHQFLQLKHLLATTPEQITTNFLSNVAFFKRYGKNIFGVTGTLGSDLEKDLLIKTYQVGTVNIPTFQLKRHALLLNMVLESIDDWTESVVTSIIANTRLGRPVLIICKTIEETEMLRKRVESVKSTAEQTFDIKKYDGLDQIADTAVSQQTLSPNSVVIATMLAGRGTDFQISKDVTDKGGLHVILTFFPEKIRVEEQGIGRAARNGQPGSSQLIILAKNEYVDRAPSNWISRGIGLLTEDRDKNEKDSLQNVLDNVLPMIEKESEQFAKYCAIREKLNTKLTGFSNKYALQWLDEQWGLALDKAKPIDYSDKSKVEALQKDLEAKIEGLGKLVDDKGANFIDVIANPQTNLLLGAGYLQNGEDFKSAKKCFEKNIETDKHFALNANYYKAYSEIQMFDSGYKEAAKKSLLAAVEGILDSISAQMAVHSFGNPSDSSEIKLDNDGKMIDKDMENKTDPEFTQQVKGRIYLLQIQMKSIQDALNNLDDSKDKTAKLIPVDEYIKTQKKEASISDAERLEAKDAGLIGFIEVINKPTPWWVLFTVILVCCVEVATGALMSTFTGGAVGEGLVVDGTMDLAITIKAAISGDYVDLKEFFVNKAISMAIMIGTFGIGRFVAKYGKKIVEVASKWGTRFMQSTVISTVVEFGQNFWSKLKSIGSKIWGVTKSAGSLLWDLMKWVGSGFKYLGLKAVGLLEKAWTKIKQFGTYIKTTRPWGWAVKAVQKMRIPEALKYLGEQWELLKKGAIAWFKDVGKPLAERFVTKLTPESVKAKQATTMLKLVAKEFARRGALEGIDWILNKQLMPMLKSLITNSLKENLKVNVETEMSSAGTIKTMDQFLGEYTSAESYDTAFRKMKKEHLMTVAETVLAEPDQKIQETVISTLSSFADKAGEVLKKEKESAGAAVKLATILERGTQLFVDLYRAQGVLRSCLTFTEQLFSGFREELNKTPHPDPTGASYINDGDGKKKYEADKTALIDEISSQIATQMAEIIVNGIITPKTEQHITNIVSKMGVFNHEHVLEKLGEIQAGLGHPERYPQGSIWNIYKGLKKKPPPAASTPHAAVNNHASVLHQVAHDLAQHVQVFHQREEHDFSLRVVDSDPNSRGPTYDEVFSAGACKKKEPLRLAIFRRDFSEDWQFQPLVRGKDGILRSISPSGMHARGMNLMECVALMSSDHYETNLKNLKYIEALY